MRAIHHLDNDPNNNDLSNLRIVEITEYAEAWCHSCEAPADADDGYCITHRPPICSACLEPITTIVEQAQVWQWGVPVTRPFHPDCAPRLIEEYPDDTVRRNGPMIIGQPCPWCGMTVTGPDHDRSHD